MAYSGIYKVKNREKYTGDVDNVVYRSLKERQIMVFFDACENILEWGSEEVIVPYVYDVDGRIHRYFPDFTCNLRSQSGEIKDYLLEYKPFSQCSPPKPPKTRHHKRQTRFLKESQTYIKNINKWKAANAWAKKNEMEFFVITEKNTKKMNFFIDCIRQ